ncbi:MAG TPA: alpha/beta hydrolase [Caulobacteraceae bacterium]|nr:alpha/beta hydrolase [Caulobacteraceae bacterium]
MSEVVTSLLGGRIPYAKVGPRPEAVVVLNGGQGFMRRPDPAVIARDARRTGRLLPPGTSFGLLGYDPAPPPGLDAEDVVAAAVRALIKRHAGPVTLAGISYGALVAVRVAAAAPEIVDRLVLIAGAHRFSTEGERRVRRQIGFAESHDPVGLTREFAAVFRRPWFNALLALRLRLSGRRLATGMADGETAARYLRAMLEAGDADLEAVKAPTLIVGGSRDQFFGDGVMQEAAARIPAARVELLDGETHMAPVERAGAVAAAIARFMDEPSATSR